MISSELFVNQLQNLGFGLFTGVPCSFLSPLINYVIDSPSLNYVGAANEGDAVAIATGSELAGIHSVVMMQNSGLGNAFNPLTSLNAIFHLPVLLIVTWRAEPGSELDEPQHELMGQITLKSLELINIAWDYCPEQDNQIETTLYKAITHMSETGRPFALVARKNSFAPYKLKTKLSTKAILRENLSNTNSITPLPTRSQVLKVVQEKAQGQDAIIATTGFTGRALYALSDLENQFYMVGSMGCASSLGLGLAISKPDKKVIVVDGDGAALMRLGALTTIGYESPKNLVHLLLDNEMHESTGGQSTVSHSIDFALIAQASGYRKVVRAYSLEDIALALKESNELTFIYAKISSEETKNLPRPTVKPPEVAKRFSLWLNK
ncbi:MAG: phosphonopyruvate decarboxylase [Acidobacteria bacterium]|nr:phosphonopyruvate decarboxylase [Acidobacteriota bacterium]